MVEAMIETLWRCVECGKWSHAKKRPTYHHKFISENDVYDPPGNVIRYMADGWTVKCGPFEKWEAHRV